MAKLDIPAGGLSLHGWPLQPTKSSTKDSTIQRSAILLKINRQTIRDLQQCSRKGEKVRLLTGRTPVRAKSLFAHLCYTNLGAIIEIAVWFQFNQFYSRP